jgi:1,2-dihydroxy-3-keto-5-methylthiopentene dioxygenase
MFPPTRNGNTPCFLCDNHDHQPIGNLTTNPPTRQNESILVRQPRGTPPLSPIKSNPTNTLPQGDQRLPHDSGRPVDPAYLSALGVTHYYFPDDLDSVNKIAAERNYKNRDEIEISPDLLPGYEEKVKTFFHEHLHEDEEIRYILGGGGYFDVRSKDDAWVRLRLEKGDLMIMPAGIYHRFTTDDQNVRYGFSLGCCLDGAVLL